MRHYTIGQISCQLHLHSKCRSISGRYTKSPLPTPSPQSLTPNPQPLFKRLGSVPGLLVTVLLCGCFSTTSSAPVLRVATFRCDATPSIGEPLIWTTPATEIEDSLWAKGIVLDDGGVRYVLCAIDWCALGGSTHLFLRSTIAEAAGTNPARVALQSVHQHTAPYVDGDAYRLLRALRSPPLLMSEESLKRLANNLSQQVKTAVTRLEPFDSVGFGSAQVERVASARRIMDNGRLITRYSTDGRNPELAALPEGAIDSTLRTITLAAGTRPLVRLHLYATHPQTFCCDGRVSGDFVDAARETLEKKENVVEIYFTGCAGDVTVGKYNDGSVAARNAFADRLERGMREAISATRFEPVTTLNWRSADLILPLKGEADASPSALRSRLQNPGDQSGQDLYRTALALAFDERRRPLPASSLGMGKTRILFLPGEPMLEFQRYAQLESPDEFIAVAGYGDISPGYLCTDRAFAEGGYEPGASNAGPGTEARVKQAILRLLGR